MQFSEEQYDAYLLRRTRIFFFFRVRYHHPSSYVTSLSTGQNFVCKLRAHFKGAQKHRSITCENVDNHGIEIILNLVVIFGIM